LAGIAPSLASRHGSIRAAFLRMQLAALARVYAAAEPLTLRLARAGTPVVT
jgi:hypothetical protein